MASIFTKIINKEIPCHKILENDKFLSFLDIRPIAEGHTLVIPKKEIDYIFDLDEDLLKEILIFSKKVSSALKKSIPCERIGLMVAGLEVPHAHIHLVPINNLEDLNFAKAKPAGQEDLENLAQRIIANLNE